MKNSQSFKGWFVVVFFVVLALTGCARLSEKVYPEVSGIENGFTQQELVVARRIRNDPRLYGIRLEPEHYARYLAVTGQGKVSR